MSYTCTCLLQDSVQPDITKDFTGNLRKPSYWLT